MTRTEYEQFTKTKLYRASHLLVAAGGIVWVVSLVCLATDHQQQANELFRAYLTMLLGPLTMQCVLACFALREYRRLHFELKVRSIACDMVRDILDEWIKQYDPKTYKRKAFSDALDKTEGLE